MPSAATLKARSERTTLVLFMVPYLVCAAGLIGTSLASYFSYNYFRIQSSSEFSKRSGLILDAIHSRVHNYTGFLTHTKAFFETGQKVTNVEFNSFAQSVDLKAEYPGVIALSYYASQLPSEKLGAWDHSKNPKQNIFPLTYSEPHSSTPPHKLQADPFSDPIRRKAMEWARDSGAVTITDKIMLPNEPARAGFLMFAPVYQKRLPTSTVLDRQKALKGFVSLTFRADDFFNTIIRKDIDEDLQIDFEVFSGTTPSIQNLLHDHDEVMHFLVPHPGDLSTIDYFQIEGSTWTLTLVSLPGFRSQSSKILPGLIFVLGTLLSLILGKMALISISSERSAGEAANRIRLLYETSQHLFSAPLRPESRLQNLAQSLVPRFADWAVVVLKEPTGKFRKVSIEGPKDHPDLVQKAFLQYPVAAELSKEFVEVLSTGKNQWHAMLQDPSYSQVSTLPIGQEILREMGAKSYLCIAIKAQDRILGAIALIRSRASPFSRAELEIAEELAMRASIAIENSMLYAESQESLQARDEFISVASHELKTPLTTIKLQSQTLQRLLESHAELEPHHARIIQMAKTTDQQTSRLNKLVEDMLDVSRIRTGKLSLERSETDLIELIREVTERLQPQAQGARCELKFLQTDTLHKIVGNWDRFRIEQIYINLLTNSFKYGAGKPITVRVWQEKNRAYFSVADRGIGIAKEAQDKIFQRFERAVSSNHIAGMGLGLYIVRKILDAHDGKISVHSIEGTGSTFTVELPL